MQIANLQELYIADLQELRDSRGQLVEASRRMSEAAHGSLLKHMLFELEHDMLLQEEWIDDILVHLGAIPVRHTDQAMAALLHEGEKMMRMLPDNDLRDAGIINSVQRVLHYDMAAFGTAAAFAGQLGRTDEARSLRQSMHQEKDRDRRLSALACMVVNPDAAAGPGAVAKPFA